MFRPVAGLFLGTMAQHLNQGDCETQEEDREVLALPNTTYTAKAEVP